MKMLSAISLFSGAGGLDIGFEQEGFHPLFANEADHYAAMTWRRNRPKTADVMVEGDIREHIFRLNNYKDVDVLFGGPPCQGFSVGGKMDPKDERSELVNTFMEAVEILNPKTFVMENVRALGALEKWKKVRDGITACGNNLGYDVSYQIHHTSDYGVPEKRDRVIFLGVRKDIGRTKIFYQNLAKHTKTPLTSRKVLLKAGKYGSDVNPKTCGAKITLAKNPILRRSPYQGMLVNGGGRPIDLDKIAPTLTASMGGNYTPIVDEAALYDTSIPNWFKSYQERLRSGTVTCF